MTASEVNPSRTDQETADQGNNQSRKGKETTKPSEPTGLVDLITSWFLLAFAIIAVSGAALRTFIPDYAKRLDETTLLYLVVGGVLLLLRQVKTLSFGGYKIEMLEKVKEQQAKQEGEIKTIGSILPLLLPDTERQYLKELESGKASDLPGGHKLHNDMQHLNSMRLIKKKNVKRWSVFKDPTSRFDLTDAIELTPLGERWANLIKDIDATEVA